MKQVTNSLRLEKSGRLAKDVSLLSLLSGDGQERMATTACAYGSTRKTTGQAWLSNGVCFSKRDEAERAETYVKAYEAKNVIVDAYALLLCLHWTLHHKRST